jgi:formate dehydrogenase iron-sulfur subunit
VERAFGLTLKELLYDYGGGSATGRAIRTVQVGGPLGAFIPASQFDVAAGYEELSAIGALLGHGGIVAFDDTRRHGQNGALCHGVLRGRVCGSAPPADRLDTWRRSDRTAYGGRGHGA